VTAPRGGLRGRRRPRVVAYTWSRQWPAEALLGLFGGVVNLAGFCAMRSYGAPDWTPQLLIVVGQGPWVLAAIWPRILGHVPRPRLFGRLGWFAKGPLLLVALADVASTGPEGRGHGDAWLFVLAVLLVYNAEAAFTPHRNALMRANYPLEIRGRVYGMITSVAVLSAMGAAILAGILIDRDARWARVVFPTAAVLGLVAHAMLARIRWRREGGEPPPSEARMGFLEALRDGWTSTWRTLRDDRDFRDFEVNFILYGLGLLAAVPLIVAFAEKDLGLSAVQWTAADRFVLPMTQLLVFPLVGRLTDRMGVVRVGALAFAVVGAFFVAMLFVTGPRSLTAAYVLYGVCMAGVNVSWALGPMLFAPPGAAHHYAAVHMAMVGIRSAMGPVLGYLVATQASFHAALVMAAGFEAVAVARMWALARRRGSR
jgi:MFS family permease